MKVVSTPFRPMKRRVFTEDQWLKLQAAPTWYLHHKLRTGRFLIGLLYQPAMLNMTPKQADFISSNLRYQMENIIDILKDRQEREAVDQLMQRMV